MTLRPTLAIALTASLLAGIAAEAQQSRETAPRTGTAALSGIVVTDEQTPQPIRRAQIAVTNAGLTVNKMVFTDEAGRFSVNGLPAGRYTVVATKAPYLRAAYGARRYDRPGTAITLAEGHQMTDITLRMTRGAVVSGVVTDENGEPAFGVSMRIMQLRVQNGERVFTQVAAGNVFGETTDDRGAYRFYGLPPGEYTVTATPRTMPGEVRAMTESEIRAVMQALQQQTSQQQTGAQPAGVANINAAQATAQTPKPQEDAVTVGYANVYYPGTTVAAMASTVSVGASEERTGVNFPLKLVHTAKIEGTVATPPGIRPQNVQLMLSPSSSGNAAAASLDLFGLTRTSPDASGKFSFTGVPPGDYVISARATAPGANAPNQPAPPPPPAPPAGATMQFRTVGAGGGGGEPMMMFTEMGDQSGQSFWGQADVTVDGSNLSGVPISLQPGMTITGKVNFRGSRLVPDGDLSRVRLMMSAAPAPGAARVSMGAPIAQVEANGQFKITGVTPGRYRITGVAPLPMGAPAGQGWTVFSVIAKGRDVLDFPLDVAPNEDINDVVVTFTDATQEVGGTLQDATGRPAPDYTIIVFADDSRYWTSPARRIRSARPGTDGRFTVANLPPGEYRIAAVVDVAPAEINDPTFLEQLVGASVKFTLAEGEKKTQDLRIAGGYN